MNWYALLNDSIIFHAICPSATASCKKSRRAVNANDHYSLRHAVGEGAVSVWIFE